MTRPDHIARMLQLDPSETGSGLDAPSAARQVQDFQSPQGRAETAEAERIAAENMTTALRLLAVFLAALIVGLTVWLSLPWIAERAAADAAIARQMMRF